MASSMEFRKEAQKITNQSSCPSISLPSSCPLNPNPVSFRPRSLYTAHNFYSQIEDSNYKRHNYSKFPEMPPCEQWVSNGLSTTGSWRSQRGLKTYPCYPYKEAPYENWRGPDVEPGVGGTLMTSCGIISLRLFNKIRIDMTIDKAIRLINFKSNIVLSLGKSGSSAALLHPNGRVHQYGSRVEIMAHDFQGNNKFAKMWYKGVSFTSEQCALVYLVDAAGTRTTTDTFSDLNRDFSIDAFYFESQTGPACIAEAISILSNAQYWVTEDGMENWIINDIRISQTPDGLVRVARNNNKYQLRTSSSHGTASLTTPYLHCTASLGQTSHLFVRRGERRMHYDGTTFIVRNAGHSAGFDEHGQLKVY